MQDPFRERESRLTLGFAVHKLCEMVVNQMVPESDRLGTPKAPFLHNGG